MSGPNEQWTSLLIWIIILLRLKARVGPGELACTHTHKCQTENLLINTLLCVCMCCHHALYNYLRLRLLFKRKFRFTHLTLSSPRQSFSLFYLRFSTNSFHCVFLSSWFNFSHSLLLLVVGLPFLGSCGFCSHLILLPTTRIHCNIVQHSNYLMAVLFKKANWVMKASNLSRFHFGIV